MSKPGKHKSKHKSLLIPNDVAEDLPRLQASYLKKNGTTFDHFYCPFMLKDEVVRLCMGHIIPESYANCQRTRVTQRADVDNFYGSIAEADFGTFLEVTGKRPDEVILNEQLQKELKPRLEVEGEEVEYYTDRGGKDSKHSRVIMQRAEDGNRKVFVFKKSQDEMQSLLNKNWIIVVERDYRLTAMVTLVKAAYLTLFQLHEYQWALSHAGIEIGYSLLGQFFRENRGKHVTDVGVTQSRHFEGGIAESFGTRGRHPGRSATSRSTS